MEETLKTHQKLLHENALLKKNIQATEQPYIERRYLEEVYRATQKQLTDVIEFLPDATLAIDKERRVIIWNKAIEIMTGIPAAEMIGKGDYAYTIPFYGEARPQLMDLIFEDRDDVLAQYPQITREGDTLKIEVFCNALYNNKGAWVFAKASPLQDEHGNIIGAIESIRDITDRKKAEEAMRRAYDEMEQRVADRTNELASINKELRTEITERKRAEEALRDGEQRFHQLADATFEGVAITESGRILDVNRSLLEMLKYEKVEELLGKSAAELTPMEYREIVKNHIAAGYEEPYESILTRKDGTTFFVEVHGKMMEMAGRQVRITAVRDISERKQAERALRESEDNYRSLFENASIGIFHSLPEGRFLRVNKALSQMFGYVSPEDMVAAITCIDTQIYIDSKKRSILLDRTLDQTDWVYAENRYRRKDGTVITANLSVRKILNGDGTVAYLEGFVEDVTERKQADEALRTSESRFRNVLQDISTVAVQGYAPDGTTQYWNQASERLYGYSAQEAIGRNLVDLIIPPEMREDVKKAIQLMAETGMPIPASELSLMRKDGSLVEVFSSHTIVQVPGRTQELFCIDIDLTERKQAAAALQMQEERLRLALASSRQGWFDLDIPSGAVKVSPEYVRMIGHDPAEFQTNLQGWIDGIHPEDRDGVLQVFHECIKAGDTRSMEYRRLTQIGEWLWLCSTGKVVEYDSEHKPLRMIGTHQDITSQKRVEEAKRNLEERLHNAEKMEMMGTMAGRVAHDLNNVLGVVSGYSELLAERLPSGNPLHEYAAKIQKSSGKAAAIVEDLLTLTRRGVRVMEAASLNNIIAQLLATPEFDKLVSYHPNVVVKTDLAKDLLNVSGSPVHLEKTVMNLVSNAVEAITGSGEVKIKTENRYLDKAINGYQTVKEGEYIVLTVSDTGKGIPSSELNSIFEPFYTKKSMGRSGTGLGLAIVWGAVQDHNGYVDVQSIEGEGSTFTLYFPATREKLEEEISITPLEQYIGHRESVLVIDDVEEQRNVATALLMQLGYQVNAVSSGEDAVEYLKSNKADLLVLDMIMEPGIDGLDTYKLVREINPHQKAIIVSGFSETDRSKEAQKLGAGAYVKKPYLKENIGMAIRDELANK